MIMLIHFFCLCPLSLTIQLNFNISKVAYYFCTILITQSRTRTYNTTVARLKSPIKFEFRKRQSITSPWLYYYYQYMVLKYSIFLIASNINSPNCGNVHLPLRGDCVLEYQSPANFLNQFNFKPQKDLSTYSKFYLVGICLVIYLG